MIAPSLFNPSTTVAFSRAIPSILSNAAKCAGATEVIKATSGLANKERGAISPGWFIPISITAKSKSSRMRAKVSGTPQWLL